MHATSGRTPFMAIALALSCALLPGHVQAGGSTFTDLLVSSFSWGVSQTGTLSFALGKDAAGRLVLQDRSPDGALRQTRLGAAVALGVPRGTLLVGPDRVAWLVLASDGASIDLYRLGDVSLPGPLQTARVDSVATSPEFAADSVQLGIIAILIGLFRAPVPTISYQDGTVHRVLVWDGTRLLPYIEQQSLR